MPIMASDVLLRVQAILLDDGLVRWPAPELRLWFNDGLREIALIKPTAVSKTIILNLDHGTKQTVPENAIAIMRVVRNLKSADENPRKGGRVVQVIDFDTMNAQFYDWHNEDRVPARKEVIHAIFDQSDPRTFWVYPANDGTGIVEAIVSKVPDGVPAPTENVNDIASYEVSIDIHDVYSGAMVDYILYRAYSKDASFAGSAARAAAHYSQFANALGVKSQNEMVRNLNMKAPQENAA